MPNAGNFNSGDGERGPGWYDVYDGLRRLRARYGADVELRLQPRHSVNGRWGIAAMVYGNVAGSVLGSAGYGPAFNDGCKTLSAACWRAVFEAECEAESVGYLQGDLGLTGD